MWRELFVGAGIRLLDGKGLIKEECLQSTFKSSEFGEMLENVIVA